MSQTNKTTVLKALRSQMQASKPVPLNAYIVHMADAHGSEYIHPSDKRIEYISGFSGSAGVAVVTETRAALWTDSRYHISASQQLDSATWTLLKQGLTGVPTVEEWLDKVLSPSSVVGVNSLTVSSVAWKSLVTNSLWKKKPLKFVCQEYSLVDRIWKERPFLPSSPISVHPVQFSGKTIGEKIKDLNSEMKRLQATVLIITELDQIAWLLNLRGSDIPFNPVFFSYCVHSLWETKFYVDPNKISPKVKQHLSEEAPDVKFTFKPYESFLSDFTDFKNVPSAYGLHFLFCGNSNQAILNVLNESKKKLDSKEKEDNFIVECSIHPVSSAKAIKNQVEIEGMKNAHIKDSVAVCSYFHWLEEKYNDPQLAKSSQNHFSIGEYEASLVLEDFRKLQKDFVSPSFQTISATGSNAAIIHYKPSETNSKIIDPNHLYLCDSGAQFLDGTTDITRTVRFRFDKTSDALKVNIEKEMFTRVLCGYLDLSAIIFPDGTNGRQLDMVARKSLWQIGCDFGHGTGHGVGSYLNVHEYPPSISNHSKAEIKLLPGMVLSNEPGFYKKDSFGIRTESLIFVKECKFENSKSHFSIRDSDSSTKYYCFEELTLIPIQTNLLLTDLMTSSQISYLNTYHQKCLDIVGKELIRQKNFKVYEWLKKQCAPISKKN